MSQAIARRIRQLEAQLEQLRDIFDTLNPQEELALFDAWGLGMIRAGALPPPDPAHPHMPFASLRHTHRDGLRELQRIVADPAWQREHRATVTAVLLRELQRIAAGKR